MDDSVRSSGVLDILITMGAAYLLPVALFIVLRAKRVVKSAPFFTGVLTFILMVIIRLSVRYFMVHDDRAGSMPSWKLSITVLMAVGLVEEIIRYVMQRWMLFEYRDWSDCVAYGLGHGCAELVVIFDIIGYSYSDLAVAGFDFLVGTGFSLAMSVMIFTAGFLAKDLKLLWAAMGCHLVIAFLPALNYGGVLTAGELMAVYILAVLVIGSTAVAVYWNFK